MPPISKRPVGSSLGCHVWGAAPLKPNIWGLSTAVFGVAARMARRLPIAQENLLQELKLFVAQKLKIWQESGLLSKLPSDADVSFETWLTRFTPTYTNSRREELRAKFKKLKKIIKRHRQCKGFLKEEFYFVLNDVYKQARGIFSREDELKCFFGPWFKQIELEVFKMPMFIKHTPVHLRPRAISSLIRPGAKYLVSDYTAFESHFTREVMEAVEFQLYDFMVSDVPGGKEFMEEVRRTIGGQNTIKFKHFTAHVNARRMSGEMCTSLGNGFTNWMLMEFAAFKHNTVVSGFVEGDDGIFVFRDNVIPNQSFFETLGWSVKLEVVNSVEEAGFCGCIFAPEDELVVTDPREVLLNFGWGSSTYINAKKIRKLELLRAKSYSFAYQYRGCPIIQELAHYGLRVSKHIDLRRYLAHDRNISAWEKEQLIFALDQVITPIEIPKATRQLVQSKYGITIEMQLEIESYLRGLTDLVPLCHPSIQTLMPSVNKSHWVHYTMSDIVNDPVLGLREYQHDLDRLSEFITFTPNAIRRGLHLKLLKPAQ